VLRSSWSVLRASLDELMDRDLGPEVAVSVEAAVRGAVPEVRAMTEFRTRRAGRRRFVELTVAFDRSLSFATAHHLSERARAAVKAAVPDAEVSVHADPHPTLPEDHPA